ncbi:MAG: bifunctional UDP-N-acetylmuramoyl-tripeptide:D-alanyl-D-alanine ligase/alanine racemase [Chitinophagaceae bacterium]
MTLYSTSAITSIVHGKCIGASNRKVQHLVTDSRKLIEPEASLFIALIGDKRNGHTYIADLIRRGVKAFLVSEPPVESTDDVSFILVHDTLLALQQLASHHRNQFHYPVIGITGSNGKTIVKEWLHFLLHEHIRIIRSPRSYNSQIGVPLSVWQMDEHADLAIFEAGISQRGEMENLEKIIRPGVGIFTNIGEAHSEGFSTKQEKINEKLKLFKDADFIIYGADYADLDEQVKIFASTKNINLITWSKKQMADYKIEENRSIDSTELMIHFEQSCIRFTIPFTDAIAIENAITCAVVMIQLGWGALLIDRMPLLPSLSMRMEMKTGINRCTLINDSYSTDIRSLRLALEFMQQQGRSQKQTVILSDIPETGIQESVLYEQVASMLTQFKIDRLIAIGPAFFRQAALIKDLETNFFVNTESFMEQFTLSAFKEEKVLIKGARKFGFERIQRALEEKRHQTVMTVNLSAIAHNITQYRKKLLPTTKIMAMVKAFSYGSGSDEIARLLQYHQVDYLAVAYADEGVELRKAGISTPIMVMNPDDHSFDQLIDFDLQPEIYSFDLLDKFNHYLEKEGLMEFPIHIKIDTGMHRLGFDPADTITLAQRLVALNSFRVMSVFTHLVGSESPDDDQFTRLQKDRFDRAVNELKEILDYDFIKHVSNTSAVLRHTDLQYDMIRLGIGLYGIDPTGFAPDLREAATLTTTIAQIREVKTDETVGYNRKGKLKRDSLIATIRIGYADGFPRVLGNGGGYVRIKGRSFPIIGSVCMDMTMIDITDDPSINMQDEVILFGKDLSVDKLAYLAGTISYDILTGISQRVKRVYIED